MDSDSISLFQKLIDVQQTLIRNPNPLKEPFPDPGKTKNKNPISVNFFFFKFNALEKYCPNENQAMKTAFKI